MQTQKQSNVFMTNLECKGRDFHLQKTRLKTGCQKHAATSIVVTRRIIVRSNWNHHAVFYYSTMHSSIDSKTK